MQILINWYSKCYTTIHWGNTLSNSIEMIAGVHQGGILSLILFALYMDALIV